MLWAIGAFSSTLLDIFDLITSASAKVMLVQNTSLTQFDILGPIKHIGRICATVFIVTKLYFYIDGILRQGCVINRKNTSDYFCFFDWICWVIKAHKQSDMNNPF